MWKKSRVRAPDGTSASSSVSGISAYASAVSHPDAASAFAMADACAGSNPTASSLRSTASAPAVEFAAPDPASTNSMNHRRIIPSKLIRDIAGTHCMPGHAGGCWSLVDDGTHRRHEVSLSEARGTPRWQKSSKPDTARTLRSTSAM